MKDYGVLESFLVAIEQQDTHKRLKAAEEIIPYVNDPDNSLDFPDVERMVDGLLGWAGSSNFKVICIRCNGKIMANYKCMNLLAYFPTLYVQVPS